MLRTSCARCLARIFTLHVQMQRGEILHGLRIFSPQGRAVPLLGNSVISLNSPAVLVHAAELIAGRSRSVCRRLVKPFHRFFQILANPSPVQECVA